MSTKQNEPRSIAVPHRRLSRVGHMGALGLGVAGNMALNGLAQLGKGQRPSMRDLMLTPANITRVTNQLAQLRGAAMKIGQLVSMDTGDFMPPELTQIMARLRDDADHMPPAQLKQVLNAQWPQNWLGSFVAFDVRPIAAASIGQVHRAQLKDGRILAVKVQYPGVAASIDSDVSNVGVLIKLSGLLPKGFELAPYLEEARQQLHEETDYTSEAAHLQRFHRLLSGDDDFVVPDVYRDWSTASILAMEYVEGIAIEDVAALPQQDRDRVARQLISLTLKELFEFGVMQTDPNFANYRYQPQTQKIVLLDFGATRDIAPQVIDQYRRLLRAGLALDAAELIKTAQEIGFISNGTDARHRSQIMQMMRLVFETLTTRNPIEFADQTVAKKLQSDGLALIEDGFVPPPLPIDVLLLQRKFAGIFLIAARLSASVNVLSLLRSALNDTAPRP